MPASSQTAQAPAAEQTEQSAAAATRAADLPTGERLSLEEMTRIMDVASTLRKERTLVDQQLNIEQVKATLRERLLEAAKVSGDPVTAAEIDAAIESYYDKLHEFREPAAGLSTFLAHAWVLRWMLVQAAAALTGAALLWSALGGW